jgi:hypothetical protein
VTRSDWLFWLSIIGVIGFAATLVWLFLGLIVTRRGHWALREGGGSEIHNLFKRTKPTKEALWSGKSIRQCASSSTILTHYIISLSNVPLDLGNWMPSWNSTISTLTIVAPMVVMPMRKASR